MSVEPFSLNKLAWEIADQSTRPVKEMLFDDEVTVVDGNKAHLRIAGPNFTVAPGDNVLAGDHVLAMRLGGYQLILKVLNRSGTLIDLDLLPTSEISPEALSADVDNWNPEGLATATLIRVTQSGAGDWKITGLEAQSGGRRIVLYNATSDTLTLGHQDAGSDEDNQFNCPGAVDLVIPSMGSREVLYSASDSKWLVAGSVA